MEDGSHRGEFRSLVLAEQLERTFIRAAAHDFDGIFRGTETLTGENLRRLFDGSELSKGFERSVRTGFLRWFLFCSRRILKASFFQ